MSRRIALPLAALALMALAGGATWAVAGGESGSNGNENTARTDARATATVTRRDLVQHETVDGTLGYADAKTLYAQAAGTVTALRQPGSIVKRGQALYWLDGRPITLMYGSLPAWRRLDASSPDGSDIRQLERNLVALGYDTSRDIEIDDEWDWATTAALKRWQEHEGLEETGAVELGEIVFLPRARRIGQLAATVGATLQPGGEVMDTTSTKRLVTVDLDADKQSLVKKGDAVTVELPDDSTIDGTIVSVSKVAESDEDPQTGERGDPTIEVKIRLDQGSKTGGFDEAPVDVAIAQETAKGVLSVPVSALLALAEGGYAVEVVDGSGSTRLLRVEPGMFADGLVEISGEGIKEGAKVVVPE
jgi:hypothetical protein